MDEKLCRIIDAKFVCDQSMFHEVVLKVKFLVDEDTKQRAHTFLTVDEAFELLRYHKVFDLKELKERTISVVGHIGYSTYMGPILNYPK